MGSSGTGKSSIFHRYITGHFLENNFPTIGASFNAKFIEKSDVTFKVDFWDTAGQERFESLIPLYYKTANIIIVVYDITSYDSYIRAKKWIITIKNDSNMEPLIILIGNMCDLSEKRIIQYGEANLYANQTGVTFYECSAKTGYNIDIMFNAAFENAYKQLVKQQKEHNKYLMDYVDLNKHKLTINQNVGSYHFGVLDRNTFIINCIIFYKLYYCQF